MAPKIGKAAGAVVSLPLNVGGNATRFLTRTLKNGSRVVKKIGSRVNRSITYLKNRTKRKGIKRVCRNRKTMRSKRH